jgi:hypothetical protein
VEAGGPRRATHFACEDQSLSPSAARAREMIPEGDWPGMIGPSVNLIFPAGFFDWWFLLLFHLRNLFIGI